MQKTLVIGLAVVVAAAGGYWAGRAWYPKGVLDGGEGVVVARFAGRTLHASAVEARLRALPEIARARLASAEARKKFIEDLARGQLLAHLAEEKGYQHDPEFAKRYADELGTFFIEKEFEEPERRKGPTDDELRKYFDEHHAELSRPERVRVALIAFKVSGAAEKEKKRAQARAALAEARSKAKDYYAFGNIARARSEDARTRASGGEVGYASRDELEHGYGAGLAQAAFEMKNANEIRSTLVESGDAFYVVKLLGREPAYEPRFEVVRDSLRGRLSSERRNADRKRFLDETWKRADVKVDEEAVKSLRVAAGRP